MKTFVTFLVLMTLWHLPVAEASVCPFPMFATARSFSTAGDGSWFVATGDFNGDGKPDAVVANFESSTVAVLLGNGDGTLQAPVTYPVGYEPQWITVADVNRDGKQDLIVASIGCAPCATGQTPGGIFVLLGNGDGTFQKGISVAQDNPSQLAVGDFNGDGKPDIMAAFSGQEFVELLVGNGDGTFQAPQQILTTQATGVAAVAIGDFNGDGKLDAVAPNNGNGDLYFIPGNGDGTFGQAIISGNQSLNDSFLFIAAADFNGDHKLDVVTIDNSGNDIQVWLGNGDGTFQNPITIAVGAGPTDLTIADFNGDGIPDIGVVNDTYPSTISILLGKGNGTFQTPVNRSVTGNAIRSLAAADFNGDGKLDLAITSQVVGLPTGLYLTLGNGDGTFQIPADYPVGQNPDFVAIGDVNGDGHPDIVVTSNGSNTVSVLLGKGNGTSAAAVNYPVGSGPSSVAIADFNGDGKPDLAVSNLGDLTVSILLGNGDGTFKAQQKTSVTFGAESLAAGDFNKDGKQDLAVVSILGVTILIGKGDGTFQPPPLLGTVGTRSGLGNIVAADLNGDGKLDLAVANTDLGTVSIYIGNGDGTFKTNVDYPADSLNSVQNLAVGDFNGDGKPDIVAADLGCNPCGQPTPAKGYIAVLFGNGDGTFQKFKTYPTGDSADSVATGDFNGDGKLDVVVTNLITDRATVLLNNGDGTFQAPVGFSADNSTNWVAVADLNGDGKPDMVVSNGGTSDVSILLNTCSCAGSACSGGKITSVVNGASFAGSFSPGQWVTIEGSGLYSGSTQVLSAVNGSYPTSSNGLSVSMGGQPAYLYYLSSSQLNVITPDLSGSGSVPVIVTNNNMQTEPFNAQLEQFAPAFFTWPGGYVVATDQNFNLKVKNGTFAGTTTTPAAPGGTVILWGTGFGPSSPSLSAGEEVPGGATYNTANPVEVTVGGQAAKVYGAAYAPGFIALVQVAIQVPQVSNGDYPVVATVGGASSPDTALLTVEQ